MIVPERTMGTRCGHMVERGHVAYPCTLPQGHEDNWGEPHYAVEVDASVRAWRRWSQQVEETPYLNDRPQDVVELPESDLDPTIKPERVVQQETNVFVGTAMDDEVSARLDRDDRLITSTLSGQNLSAREQRWAEVLGFHHLNTDTIVGSHQRDQLDAALVLADSEYENLTQEIVLLHQILQEVRSGKSRWDHN